MDSLVMRSDVVTLKATTEQLQGDMGIDVHEAADIVLAVLRKHGSSMQFWKIPSRGLPYKDDEPRQRHYSNEWLESRWWDQEHQQRQHEIRELAGVTSNPDDDRIEEMALLRKDAYRLFFSEFLDEVMGRCTAMPKDRLVSITKLLSLISVFSDGKAQIPELARAFSDVYDPQRTMIYRGCTGWLCQPLNIGDHFGFNMRADLACDFCNCSEDLDADFGQYLILKHDAASIAQKLWMTFFNEKLNDPIVSLGLNGLESKPDQTTLTEIKAGIEADIALRLPTSFGYLSAQVQEKRQAMLSEAGLLGARVRNKQYQELKEWAIGKADGMRGAHKDVARKLFAQLPEHLADASKDPERLIYDALRSSAKPD
jgi:hypothetical protein